MKQRCRLCTVNVLKLPIELADEICVNCRFTLGIVPLPQPARPPMPCGKCGGYKFVRAIQRQIVPNPINHHRAVPVGTTWNIDRRGIQIGVVDIPGCKPALDGARGLISLYICAACGFVELYCDDPAGLPLGPEYNTDVVDYTASQRG